MVKPGNHNDTTQNDGILADGPNIVTCSTFYAFSTDGEPITTNCVRIQHNSAQNSDMGDNVVVGNFFTGSAYFKTQIGITDDQSVHFTDNVFDDTDGAGCAVHGRSFGNNLAWESNTYLSDGSPVLFPDPTPSASGHFRKEGGPPALHPVIRPFYFLITKSPGISLKSTPSAQGFQTESR